MVFWQALSYFFWVAVGIRDEENTANNYKYLKKKKKSSGYSFKLAAILKDFSCFVIFHEKYQAREFELPLVY